MQGALKKLPEIIVCATCGGSLAVESVCERFVCNSCGESFKIINSVPCFVSEALEGYSEVPREKREKFLAMKRVAYGEESIVSMMYRHYHRYAAQKRGESGERRLTIDIGCGIGEHYPFISNQEKSASSFIGIDLDRFKLEYFSSLHPEIPLLQASAFRLPFAAESVDVVQMLAILEHFSTVEITGLIDEAVRILKPGGALIACYPAEGGGLLRLCQQVMHAYLKRRTGFDLDKGAVHRHLTAAVEIRAALGERRELERLETCFYPFGIRSVNLSLFLNELYRKR